MNSPDGGFGSSHDRPFMFDKAGIQGRVTLNGANAAGITVTLMRYDLQTQPVEVSTTNTGSDGIYQFTAAPNLPAGQVYFVQYLNETNPSRLYGWVTASVSSYTAGQNVYAGNFDIAEVTLGAPDSANLYSPYTFNWTRRPNTPTDRYEVEVYDSDYSPYTLEDTDAYGNSYSLGSISAGFSVNTTYAWDIMVDSPDGGYGISNDSHLFTFR